MFTKACLLSIVALLTAILINQRSQQVVHAEASIEYKDVGAGVYLTPDGKEVGPGQNARYFSTQDVLNEYGKNGWQLVSTYYAQYENVRLHLIFMRK